jgi:hypothetical protein
MSVRMATNPSTKPNIGKSQLNFEFIRQKLINLTLNINNAFKARKCQPSQKHYVLSIGHRLYSNQIDSLQPFQLTCNKLHGLVVQ